MSVPQMTWTIKPFEELNVNELYQCFRLREQVFFLEQKVDCEDMDDLDQVAIHLFSGEPVDRYCRIFGPAAGSNYAKIGRVVVAQQARGQGQGKALMQAAIEYCRQQWPEAPIKIGAQAYLQRFYEELGFNISGDEFDEGGIPHYPMTLTHR